MFGQPSPMDTLEARLAEAIELLDRCGERYWVLRLNMALKGVRANRLGGVSQVLGFFGGEGTLSDLELLIEERDANPKAHAVANAKLKALRNSLFRLADEISNATARG